MDGWMDGWNVGCRWKGGGCAWVYIWFGRLKVNQPDITDRQATDWGLDSSYLPQSVTKNLSLSLLSLSMSLNLSMGKC